MASHKAKNILSWIIAIIIGFLAVKLLFYILNVAIFALFSFMKFFMILVLLAIVAIPTYVVIRRMLIK